MGTMSDATVRQMVALLKDPVFWGLRTLVDEHPLSWEEFEQLEMPADLTRTQTWDILNALRRQTAIELPFRDGEGRCGWYYPTRSITADLDDIDKRCHEGSWLDLATRSRNTVYFLVEAHVDEAIATLGEDGLAIGYEKAREVLLAEREPESPEERLLLNWQRATWDIEELVDEPCTPETILGVYDRISCGAGEQTTRSLRQGSRLWKRKQIDRPAALTLVAKIIEENVNAFDEHPLLLAQGVRHLFMSVLPLHAWNGIVCSLMMKLLFRKTHRPVLALVPIVKASREWERGALRPPAVMASIEDAEVLIDGEVDYTIHIDVTTQLVRRKLDEVETELKRMLKRDEAFVRALRNDLNLNHRQRAVLQAALSNPEAVFRIESHQKTHRVAYATARADLYALVDLGFLGCVRAKRAFEFPVTPGLRQLLMGPGWKNRP
ncbi:hypothetical protein [Eggerthella sinensis]|uniref:hypothetical protein n=1 Tax=Eggerthella sinensis TaxID=242230 RepID=UPI00266D037C|nr:hypothetical protein [Eggerthella sinensis]